MALDVRLKKSDRIYQPGETVSGLVVVQSEKGSSLAHSGITLRVEGKVQLQLSPKSVGLLEAFYSSLKPIDVLAYTIEVAPSGKLPPGVSELPFEFVLDPVKGQRLFETYHGVYVNIQYIIECDVPRPRLAKNLRKTLEFIVEMPSAKKGKSKERIPFEIAPDSLQNVGKKLQDSIAKFRVTGHLSSAVCDITEPFTGEIVVEESEAEVESIDLQLTRVETCGTGEAGMNAKEATEIQSLQLVHGNPCRGMAVPIYMVFPRLFTCPTVTVRTFKVQFEINIIIQFCDGYQITENFPIQLVRNP